MAAKYCAVCQKPVQPIDGPDWVDVVLSFLTLGLWGLYAVFKKEKCPICRNSATLMKL